MKSLPAPRLTVSTPSPYPTMKKSVLSGDALKYAGRPIHLTATCKVNANASAGVNAQALHNPTGGPIEISQFKFGMNASVSGGVGAEMVGGTLGVALDLNGVPITNGYVPIWNFDKTTNVSNEQLQGLIVSDYGEFCWNLSRPLWLAPDDQINATFQHFGMTSQAINARVSIAGRCVPFSAKRRYIPYATAYSSKVFTTVAGAADSDQSTETDLVNVTNDMVYVARLTGRAYAFWANTPTFYEGGIIGTVAVEDFPGNLLTVQIYTGHGEPIVPYSTTFRNVFCAPTRSWELGGIPLKPGDYNIVALTKAAAGGGSTQVIYGQAMVGLVGWRQVDV